MGVVRTPSFVTRCQPTKPWGTRCLAMTRSGFVRLNCQTFSDHTRFVQARPSLSPAHTDVRWGDGRRKKKHSCDVWLSRELCFPF